MFTVSVQYYNLLILFVCVYEHFMNQTNTSDLFIKFLSSPLAKQFYTFLISITVTYLLIRAVKRVANLKD